MDYVKLGSTGLEVSKLCLGCMSYGDPERGGHPWSLPEDQSRPVPAQGAGRRGQLLRHRERVLRRLQRGDPRLGAAQEGPTATRWSSRPRSSARCGRAPTAAGLSRKAILAEIDDSLRRLGTDYIDLYQIHRWDSGTPIEETLRGAARRRAAGKVRYLGASSMWAWQFAKALYLQERHGWTPLREHAGPLQPALPRGGAGDAAAVRRPRASAVIPWSPLARGKLTRDWDATTSRSETDEFGKTLYRDSDAQIVEAVARVAERRGVSRAQVALAWVARNPVVTSPIVGATKPHQLDDALAAIELELTDDEVAELEAPYEAHEVAGF